MTRFKCDITNGSKRKELIKIELAKPMQILSIP